MKMKILIQVHTAPLVQYRNEKMFYVLCHKAAALVGYLAFLISVLNIGGWQKNACKNNLYKEGEDTLAFKCPKDCFLESLGMHNERDQ